ncbi:MAG: isoamylase early set domain-containing protein [Gemmatimonadales bacterium]
MMEPDDQLHDPRLERAVALLRGSAPDVSGLAARTGARRRRRARRNLLLGGGGGTAAALALTLTLVGSGGGEKVTFALAALPGAHSVALVGDFTDWRTDRLQLKAEGDGRWRVTVKLPPGRYRFAYVVDGGEWRADAAAAPVLDDFGRPTSVMTVGTE